jgi:acyl-CoA thioester hydrolase
MVPCVIRVIYGDTDQMGVVYYANYLRWFEAGRGEFLRVKGLSYQEFERELRLTLPVSKAGVTYRAPARYDDLIRVETSLEEMRRVSARFSYRVVRGETLLATGFTVHACVDLEGRVRRLPPDFLARLAEGEALSGHGS